MGRILLNQLPLFFKYLNCISNTLYFKFKFLCIYTIAFILFPLQFQIIILECFRFPCSPFYIPLDGGLWFFSGQYIKYMLLGTLVIWMQTLRKHMCLVAQSCLTLCVPMDFSAPGSSVRGASLGKNTGVGFIPSSRESSQPREQTQVSCIAGGFFTI